MNSEIQCCFVLKVACLFDILVLNNKVKPAMTMRGGHIGMYFGYGHDGFDFCYLTHFPNKHL